jgi:hypothetical protein
VYILWLLFLMLGAYEIHQKGQGADETHQKGPGVRK